MRDGVVDFDIGQEVLLLGRLSALRGIPDELRESRRALIVLPRLASMPSAMRRLRSYWAEQWSASAVANLSDHEVLRIVAVAIETGQLQAAVLLRIVAATSEENLDAPANALARAVVGHGVVALTQVLHRAARRGAAGEGGGWPSGRPSVGDATEQATRREMAAARAERLKARLKAHQEKARFEQEVARSVKAPAYAALRAFKQNEDNSAFEQRGSSSATWPEASNKLILEKFGTDIPENKKTPSAAEIVNYQSDEEFKDGFKDRHPDTWQMHDLDTIHGEMYQGKIFINRDKSSAKGEEGRWTVTHEQLHYYSSEIFITTFMNFEGVMVNEGVTEYFTRQISNVKRSGCYKTETEVAIMLAIVFGEDALKKAYFGGDEATIEAMKVWLEVLHNAAASRKKP